MIENIRCIIHDWYCIDLTQAQVEAVLASDPELAADCKGGFDTSSREWFIDSLGDYVGAKGSWPIYQDSYGYSLAYWIYLKAKLEVAGIKVTKEYEKFLVP